MYGNNQSLIDLLCNIAERRGDGKQASEIVRTKRRERETSRQAREILRAEKGVKRILV
jgi:hypothetical protein